MKISKELRDYKIGITAGLVTGIAISTYQMSLDGSSSVLIASLVMLSVFLFLDFIAKLLIKAK